MKTETLRTVEVIERPHDVIAVDVATGERIGSFDKLAGAQRGTIRGRIVARTFPAWLEAIEALEHPDDCAYCQAGESSAHAYEPVTL
ncbi:MAG: hypothetical protein BGN98_13690 [Microbacterium sp. 69-7]|uniref:hypothetical protein n=1 Tax=Microbacterium sp. 69-7 TaxID=1895784 RepID=UPI000967D7FA|nr:hypothetical protein [Microbacterium sp. 69-7]OJU44432.1 MAG: hypothetical protein BGN98_13690 [Microbacterium sp. 69-7]